MYPHSHDRMESASQAPRRSTNGSIPLSASDHALPAPADTDSAGPAEVGSNSKTTHAEAEDGADRSSSSREMRKTEAELRRREAEVVNLERRLKQSKENLRVSEQENEAREQALTALVRSLEERLARKESKESKESKDAISSRSSSGSPENKNDEGREWRVLMEQLREAARQLSRGSACSDDDVKAILHKVLKDAAANKHKVLELKEDVARHKHVLATLEEEKARAISRASQVEKEVDAYAAQLLQLKLEIARRDREAEEENGGGQGERRGGEGREVRGGERGNGSPERRELESRVVKILKSQLWRRRFYFEKILEQ